MAHDVVEGVVHRDTANCVEEPNSTLPQTQQKTSAAGDQKEGTRYCPAQHFKLVAIVSFLKRDNKKDDSKC